VGFRAIQQYLGEGREHSPSSGRAARAPLVIIASPRPCSSMARWGLQQRASVRRLRGREDLCALDGSTLHFSRAGAELDRPFLLARYAAHARLPRQQAEGLLPRLESRFISVVIRVVVVADARLTEAAFLPHGPREGPDEEAVVQVWVAGFLSPVGDDAVVAAEVARAEAGDVELEFGQEARQGAAGEGSGVAGVAGEELVGAEAGEEDAGWGGVGVGGVGGGVGDGAAAAGGEVEGVGDGEVHFGVVRVHEGDDAVAVLQGLGVGDVDGDEAPGSAWTDLLELGVGGLAGYTVGALIVWIRIRGRMLLCRRENTGILEGDVE